MRSILSILRWRVRARADYPRTLEAENTNLSLELEELKKYTEPKATDLESEINMLREEIESLKTELGVEDKVSGAPPTPNREKQKK